jgi:hypothetical protein
MNIENIKSSSRLKPGQLLVMWNARRWRAVDESLRLRSSSGEYQFYRHRQDPVPGIHRSRRGRILRHPRTTNERRAALATRNSREFLQVYDTVFKLRRKRTSNALPSAYDDLFIRYQRSWKKHRRSQRKLTDNINRDIHSPPFWVTKKASP